MCTLGFSGIFPILERQTFLLWKVNESELKPHGEVNLPLCTVNSSLVKVNYPYPDTPCMVYMPTLQSHGVFGL